MAQDLGPDKQDLHLLIAYPLHLWLSNIGFQQLTEIEHYYLITTLKYV